MGIVWPPPLFKALELTWLDKLIIGKSMKTTKHTEALDLIIGKKGTANREDFELDVAKDKMEETLADMVEHIIYRAEFNSGGSEDEKFDNSVATKDMIEDFVNQKVIKELEKLKKDGFTLVDSESTVKGNYVIAAYRFDEFLEQLKQ